MQFFKKDRIILYPRILVLVLHTLLLAIFLTFFFYLISWFWRFDSDIHKTILTLLFFLSPVVALIWFLLSLKVVVAEKPGITIIRLIPFGRQKFTWLDIKWYSWSEGSSRRAMYYRYPVKVVTLHTKTGKSYSFDDFLYKNLWDLEVMVDHRVPIFSSSSSRKAKQRLDSVSFNYRQRGELLVFFVVLFIVLLTFFISSVLLIMENQSDLALLYFTLAALGLLTVVAGMISNFRRWRFFRGEVRRLEGKGNDW